MKQSVFLRIQVRASSQTKFWIETENGMRLPRSQSSSAIPDVTSPVKLVGKASSDHSDSANRLGYEAGNEGLGRDVKTFFLSPHTPCETLTLNRF